MPATCTADGCDRPHKARGLCASHYMEQRRAAAGPKPPKAPQPTCSAEGCSRPVKARGFCSRHYQWMRTRGGLSPLSPPPVSVEEQVRWDAAAVAVGYRMRIEAARARVTQALIVLGHPDTAFPCDADALLIDALSELDLGRD